MILKSINFNNYILILILVILNVVLKCVYIDSSDISHDEPFSIFYAQKDVSRIIYDLKFYNNPPLYEIILHYWIYLFGIKPISVRLFSTIIISLSALLIFHLGKNNLNKRIGISSSLIFTFSTISFYYAHDARAYPLFIFLTLLNTILLFKLIKSYTNITATLFIFSTTLLIYTHYFGFIVLFIQLFFLFTFRLKKPIITCYIISFSLYLPQFNILIERFFLNSQNGTWLNKPSGIESLYNMLWSFLNTPVLTVICIILIFIFIIRYKNIVTTYNNFFIHYSALLFFIPFFGMFLISYYIPMYLDRYLIFCVPFLYFIITVSSQHIFTNPRLKNLSIFTLVALFAFTMNINPDKKRDIKGAVSYLKCNMKDKDVLIICPKDFLPSFLYHFDINCFEKSKNSNSKDDLIIEFKNKNIYFIDSFKELNEIIELNSDNLFYFDAEAEFAMPNNKILNNIEEKYDIIEKTKKKESFIIYRCIKNN